MIIDDNHPDQGLIKQFASQEEFIEALKQEQANQDKKTFKFGSGPISTILLEKERQALETIPQAQRAQVLKDMRSKNKSAQRRAKKKIANASRRRNRK